MESNSICNRTSDNKIERPRSGSPICLSRVYDYRPNWTTRSLVTNNHKNYNFREKKNSQVMKERENFLNYNFECDWLI